MNYWVISPNVSANPDEQPAWESAILEKGLAFMGWDEDHALGQKFIDEIQIGDFILIAQGANRKKRIVMGGVVSSNAIYGQINGTPRETHYRRLEPILSKEELVKLNLSFIGAAFGDADRIPAIYVLHPYKTTADKVLIDKIYNGLVAKTKSMNIQRKIELLEYKFQIILQGPPGTGKTYTAKDIAESMLFGSVTADKKEQKNKLEGSEQFKMIQFHPAYSYEDFVRGITAKTIGTQVEYKTENKVLAEFAERANKNYLDSDKDNEQLQEEVLFDNNFDAFKTQIQNELDSSGPIALTVNISLTHLDDDAFVFQGKGWQGRLLFSQIKKIYLYKIKSREDVFNYPDIAKHVVHRTAYYFPIVEKFRNAFPSGTVSGHAVEKVALKKYILVIDEINRANLPAVLGELIYGLEYRGENIETMYDIDGDRQLNLPTNLFIIGTMNTADRSIGHIDYAIKRRFAFVDLLPSKEPVHHLALPLFKKVSELFVKNFETIDWQKPILERSDFLASDFRVEDVWIGHSYFISNRIESEMARKELRLKRDFEILPLLKEYLKDGILLEKSDFMIKEIEKFGI